MSLLRMDNVLFVVEDLEAAITSTGCATSAVRKASSSDWLNRSADHQAAASQRR